MSENAVGMHERLLVSLLNKSCYEIAALKFMAAAKRFRVVLDYETRFNPYHDQVGRFTTAEGDVAGGQSGREDQVRVAQAGGGRAYRSGIRARFPTASPAQEVRLAVAEAMARSVAADIQARGGTWRRPASLRDPDSINGAIAEAEAEYAAAEARFREIEADPFAVNPNSASGRTPQSLKDICLPGGQVIGTRSRGAGKDAITVPAAKFDNLIRQLKDGSVEIEASPTYEGLWFRKHDQTVFGARMSVQHGLTIDIIDSLGNPDLPPGTRVHYGY